jgi:hypothetical protein
LFGSTDEVTMRYFTLVAALLLDPAAVLLLLATSERRTFAAGYLGAAHQLTKVRIR